MNDKNLRTTEAQRRARKKYNAKRKRLALDFYPTEHELFDYIEKQPQKQAYIKALIRADMERTK